MSVLAGVLYTGGGALVAAVLWAFLWAALVALLVYVVCWVVLPLRPYAQIAAAVAFVLVLLLSLL